MPTTIHPIRPDVLPQMTRFVQVAGVTFTVHIHKEGGKRLAWHDAALTEIALMLADERDWFVDGEGARLYLYGRAFQRRAAVQAVFGEGA